MTLSKYCKLLFTELIIESWLEQQFSKFLFYPFTKIFFDCFIIIFIACQLFLGNIMCHFNTYS